MPKNSIAINICPATWNIDPITDTPTIENFFIDANHRYEPTCRYVEFLALRAQEKSMVIIDDIHYSEEMERAWKTIQCRKDVSTTMDFFDFGIVFFDSHYLKKHYRLRI